MIRDGGGELDLGHGFPRLDLLASLARRLNGAVGLKDLLGAVLPLIGDLVGSSKGWIWLKEEGRRFDLAAVFGLPRELYLEKRSLFRWGPCQCQETFFQRVPEHKFVVSPCSRFQGAGGRLAGLHHVTVPLEAEGIPLGLLNLVYPAGRRLMEGSAAALLDLVGDMLSAAIRRLQLREPAKGTAETAMVKESAADYRIGGKEEESGRKSLVPLDKHVHELTLQSASDGIMAIDGEGRVIFANDSALEMLGYASEEVLGRPQHQVLRCTDRHGRDREPEVCPLCRGLEEAVGHWCREATFRRKDGTMFPVEYTCLPIMEQGRFKGGIVTFQDISVRKREERERERLLAIIEETPDFVATADAEGRVLYYNRAARCMLGLGDDEDVTGVRIPDTHPEWAGRLVMERGLPTAAREGVWTGETALLGRDGREIPVLQVIIAHKDGNGTVEYYSTIARDITERKRMEARLQYLASNDSLTGLLNRERFQEKLAAELEKAKKSGSSGTLLFVDLDNFKDFNDTLGHQTGDEILRRVARILESNVRRTDRVARLGGDEFAILLPETDAKTGWEIGNRILASLRSEVLRSGGRTIRLDASIGLASFPQEADTVNDLLIHADLAMYEAKRRGGGRVSRCTVPMRRRKRVASRMAWEQKIREALQKDGFLLYWQPILDLRRRQVVAYELLLRMKGEEGVIGPKEFLPVAERSNLISAIDRWVMRQAIRVLALLTAARSPLEGLHVNVSAKSFADDSLIGVVAEELKKYEVDPRRLVLEITETAAIEDVEKAEFFLESLRAMGCRFALDDFGVGFSTFDSLRRLPVDFLKIDGSFIERLAEDPVNQQLVQAMVAVARGLGKKTIAEFIPDAQTLELAAQYGVDYGQGYYIGPPQPSPGFDG